VKFHVVATFEGDAQPVLDRLWSRHHPDSGRSLIVTHATVEGACLKLVVVCAVRGGYASDVRRVLERAVRDVGLHLRAFEANVMERQRV